ncbi:MAG: hypothetical protein F4X92_04740, partial [Gammaproteobacteria bacterium]|nr:hypothetical protein [Gammaproteobacteria bacterium]
MNSQYWITAGILLAALLLWVFVKRSDVRKESRSLNRKRLGNEDTKAAYSNSPARLALDLAESFLQQGETEIASRYIDEVLEEGSEEQKEHARQLK